MYYKEELVTVRPAQEQSAANQAQSIDQDFARYRSDILDISLEDFDPKDIQAFTSVRDALLSLFDQTVGHISSISPGRDLSFEIEKVNLVRGESEEMSLIDQIRIVMNSTFELSQLTSSSYFTYLTDQYNLLIDRML